jgi:hypothetical protein
MPYYNIKHRRGTTAQWSSYNEILTAGEIGVEELGSGFVKIKIGNGAEPWSSLPYVISGGNQPTVFAVFQANHPYQAGEAIYDYTSNDILIAKNDFISLSLINRDDWHAIGNIIPEFVAGMYYGTNSVIFNPTEGVLYIAKSNLAYPTTFNPNDWYVIGDSNILSDFTANYAYKQGAIIYHDNAIYVAKADFTSTTAFDAADWDVGNVTSFEALTGDPYDNTLLADELEKIGDLTLLDPDLASNTDLVGAINQVREKAEEAVNIKGTFAYGTTDAAAMALIPTATLAIGDKCWNQATSTYSEWDGTTWNAETISYGLGDQYIIEAFWGTVKGTVYTGNAGAVVTCTNTSTPEFALQVLGAGSVLQDSVVLTASSGVIIDTPTYAVNYVYAEDGTDNEITFTASIKTPASGRSINIVTAQGDRLDEQSSDGTTVNKIFVFVPGDNKPVTISVLYYDSADATANDAVNLIYFPFSGQTKKAVLQILPKKIAQFL